MQYKEWVTVLSCSFLDLDTEEMDFFPLKDKVLQLTF